MKTIDIIECKTCGGQYYAGQNNITLHAGNERNEADELYFSILKVQRCTACKAREDRTRGGRKKKI